MRSRFAFFHSRPLSLTVGLVMLDWGMSLGGDVSWTCGISTMEHSASSNDEDLDRLVEEFVVPRTGVWQLGRERGVRVLEFPGIDNFPGLAAHRKLLLLVLWLALKDRATEVRFEPWENEAGERCLRLFEEVGGELHELVPAPFSVRDVVVAELKKVAGLVGMRARFATALRALADRVHRQPPSHRLGRFRLREGEEWAEVEASFYASEWGDRVFLKFGSYPERLSAEAGRKLRQYLEHRRDDRVVFQDREC